MHLSSPQLFNSLLLLGLTGCVSQARVSPTVDGDTLTRREKIELAGNPEVGTIIHIRQLHRVGVDRAPAEIDRYQAEIEKELRRLGLLDRRPVLVSVCWAVPESWVLAPLVNPHC